MEENIIGNVKAGRVRIYKFSTFKAFTEEENAIYNDKKKSQDELLEEIRKFKTDDTRSIDGKYLYHNYKNTDGKIDKTKENEKYQIAIFENDIVRLALADREEVTPYYQLLDEIVYLEIRHNHNDVLQQIIEKGIIIADEKYILYTATTGQVRNTTVTLIKEDFFEEHKGYLLVGLTEKMINEKSGIDSECGMNVGKYLAYKALPLSSSVLPAKEIDIDRCILVKGLETTITDMVKFIDIQKDEKGQYYVADTPEDYVEKSILIEHTDGAGMFLPGELPSSCQIRGGFFKGAMFPFDFRKFAKEIAHNSKVVDAYGKEIDVEEQDIKYIFTTSQLKMWKKYSSWDDYKKAFKENKIKISINNYANPAKDTVNFSYQYLQTLPYGCNITKICDPAKKDLIKLHSDLEYVKEVMGYADDSQTEIDENQDDEISDDINDVQAGTTQNTDKSCNSVIAEALNLYPELIYDAHINNKIKKLAWARRRNYRSGKIPVHGYYSYAAPDMYAFCEFLFCRNKNPQGIVPKNHIYNKYYDEKGTVDHLLCLRSPHLSRYEYGKRDLVKTKQCREWFKYMESDTIVSCHDLLSKTLQMDWDGDEILVSDDTELYDFVKDIPSEPLYYEMQQANPQQITLKAIYETLAKGFDNNVIGESSNAITKLWNTPEAMKNNPIPYDDAINVFCAYSNYAIDYPKTGKSLALGQYEELYTDLFKNVKCPNFFKEAKGKHGVAKPTKNIMDRIKKYIGEGTGRLSFTYLNQDEENSNFNYCMLMNNDKNEDGTAKYKVNRYALKYRKLYLALKVKKATKRDLCREIDKGNKQKNVDSVDITAKYETFHYHCVREIKEIFTNKDGLFNVDLAVNYLIDMEYTKHEFVSGSKDILWKCFGHIILENLKKNLNSDIVIQARPRLAYNKAIEGDIEIDKTIQEKMNSRRSVNITKNDYEFIKNHLQKHKNGNLFKNDFELLFTFYCLYKEAKENKHLQNEYFIITKKKHVVKYDEHNKKRKKKTFFNMNMIMEIAGVKSYAGSFKRFRDTKDIEKDIEIIEDEDNKNYKIKFSALYTEDEILFNVENVYNPMIYWQSYSENKPINKCKVCGKDFIREKNWKTCGEPCRNLLHRLNQARLNEVKQKSLQEEITVI